MIPVLLDRTHKRWFVGSTLVAAIGAATYVGNALHSIHGAKGGSVLGMLFGILGSACMVFAAMLSVRRRLPTLRVGSAKFWLRGHLWLGTLGFVLILFHSGFRWGGLLENLMWVSFVLVIVTGFFGVILQQIIPRLLTSEVPLETIVSQIPSLSNMSVFRADKIVASKVGVLDVDFEPLRMDALNVLKRQEQSISDRPGDFPKELAKVYANVPFIESHKEQAAPPTVAPIVQTKPPPVRNEPPPADLEGGNSEVKPKPPLELVRKQAAAQPAGDETAKPKTPLELNREKAAAKVAVDDGGAKPKTPLEMIREKAAAKAAGDGTKKAKTPLEIIREKAAAKAGGDGIAKPKTPLEVIREKSAADALADKAAKQKSSLEIMRQRTVATLAAEDAAKSLVAHGSAKTASEKKPSPIEPMPSRDDVPVGVSLMTGKPTKYLIPITCARCGKMFTVAPRHAGKQGRCPVNECQAPYTVPTPDESDSVALRKNSPAPAGEKKVSVLDQLKARLAAAMTMSLLPSQPKKQLISIMCANCGTVFTVSSRHAGKQGRCKVDACQAPYTVPQPSDESEETPYAPREANQTPLTLTIQMQFNRDTGAASAPPSGEPAEPLAPIEQTPAKLAPSVAPPPPSDEPAKPLSPIEKLRAKKLLAAKESPVDQPARTPQPLAAEKPAVTPSVVDLPAAEQPLEEAPAKPRTKKVSAPISLELLDVLRDFHIKMVRPFLISGRSPKRRLEDSDTARQLFAQMRADLPAELHESLQQLFVLCEERRQFNTQLRLHRWLHWWLLVHIPPSIALLVLFVAHVVVSLRVVPFVW